MHSPTLMNAPAAGVRPHRAFVNEIIWDYQHCPAVRRMRPACISVFFSSFKFNFSLVLYLYFRFNFKSICSMFFYRDWQHERETLSQLWTSRLVELPSAESCVRKILLFGYRWLHVHTRFDRSRSFKVISFCTNWRPVYDFLITISD